MRYTSNTPRIDNEPPKNSAPKGTVRQSFATDCNSTKQNQPTPIYWQGSVCAPDKTRIAIDEIM